MSGPSGTITLLFTDIVGSTDLWERQPDSMRVALARHDKLMRDAIEGERGHVFKTVGDAFCASFADAADAVRAAAAAQRGLGAEPWPREVDLEVRMGLHTGVCDERDGDYFGPVVNRAARLSAIANGGQIVASSTTAELLRGPLTEVGLTDLGVHRLSDLSRPMHVYQVNAPGLAHEFPALRSLDNESYLHNLPLQLTSFVGREKALRQLRGVLSDHRLVTLVGSGGAGKTRLALQCAAEQVGAFVDGVWFVDLASVSDERLVATTILATLGARDDPSQSGTGALLEVLRRRTTLLVLDNCEHVIDECATLVSRVLSHCADVKVVVTSREPLGVTGEVVFRVSPLELPDRDSVDVDVATVAGTEAVALFLERARESRPDFVLDELSVGPVLTLCRQLDGIPLALELAAGRMRTMGLDDVVRRLDQRFRLLTGGSRTALPRQRTLEATVAWSFEPLSEAESGLLEQLSVFAGFDLEAVEGLGSSQPDRGWSDDLVASLVDKSLIQMDEVAGAVRYRQLESIRQFSAERLASRGAPAVDAARLAHATYFLAYAERSATLLRGPGSLERDRRLVADLENMRQAMSYFMLADDPESTQRLIGDLSAFWLNHDPDRELVALFERALEHAAGQLPTRARSRTTRVMARLMASGDVARSEALYRESIAIAHEIGDRVEESDACQLLAFVLLVSRDFAQGFSLANRSLELLNGLDAPWQRMRALERRGLAQMATDTSAARADLLAALRLAQEVGDWVRRFNIESNIGNFEAIAGDYELARHYLERAASHLGPNPSVHSEGSARNTLATVHIALGEVELAARQIIIMTNVARRFDTPMISGYTFLNGALVLGASHDVADAVRWLGIADRIFAEVGVEPELFEERMRAEFVRKARAELGDGEYQRLHEEYAGVDSTSGLLGLRGALMEAFLTSDAVK
ncbi:MAG: adenylate/guanylate cyclase domain-containing protein [Acidimicrobiales bacterium]